MQLQYMFCDTLVLFLSVDIPNHEDAIESW